MTKYHKVFKMKCGEMVVCRSPVSDNREHLRSQIIEVENPVIIYSYQMEIADEVMNGFMFKPWIEVTNDTRYYINVDNIVSVSNLNDTLIEKYEAFVTKHPQEKISFTSPGEKQEQEEDELLAFRHLIKGGNSIN